MHQYRNVIVLLNYDRVTYNLVNTTKKLYHKEGMGHWTASNPKGKELMKGGTADNTGRNEIRVARKTQNSHWSKCIRQSNLIRNSIQIPFL